MDRGVLKPFPCDVTNTYQGQLLCICNGSRSASNKPDARALRQRCAREDLCGRLPKRVVFGNFKGAVQRGRDGKEKEWIDCVQGDIRAFGIAGDWKATALKTEVWVETIAKGGPRFMTAWRK